MTDINVDHVAYQQANKQYGDVVPAIQQTATALTNSVQAAQAGWKGQAYVAFAGFHDRLNTSVTKLHQALNEVNETLGKGNTSYSNVDDHNQTHFTSLG